MQALMDARGSLQAFTAGSHSVAEVLGYVAMRNLINEVRAQRGLPSPGMARAIREAAGISQSRLAEELGVDRVTVTRWETGARRPRGARAATYARLLARLKDLVG